MFFFIQINIEIVFSTFEKWREDRDKLVMQLEMILKDKESKLVELSKDIKHEAGIHHQVGILATSAHHIQYAQVTY